MSPDTGVMGGVEFVRGVQSQVALPLHAEKPKGLADVHCQAQHAEVGCEDTQSGEHAAVVSSW